MKISERIPDPPDPKDVEELRRFEAEEFNRMKREFQDFLAQTRSRIQMICDALGELNQDQSDPAEQGSHWSEIERTAEGIADPRSQPEPVLTTETVTSEPGFSHPTTAQLPPGTHGTPGLAATDRSDPFDRINAIKERLARQMKSP